MLLYPFNDYWWFYVGFIAFVMVILLLDLGVFHKEAHEVSLKESTIWTGVWFSLAFIFNIAFYFFSLYQFNNHPYYSALPDFIPDAAAKQSALEFLTGFIIEKSLAVDNLFVFAVVFSYFAIPKKYQHRILFWGILGALLFRAIFIAIGSVLMEYQSVVIFFGALLVLTGIKMFFSGSEEQNLENNFIVKQLKRIFRIHPHIEGEKFSIKKDGVRYFTPLFLALVFIELTDIIFAVDSVPAIFSITKEPLIVFTSNIFAILGLRSMYFMLSGVMDKFIYIKYGLGFVLIFVGSKMVYLNKLFNGHFPIVLSLAIIAFFIGGSIIASILFPPKAKLTSN